MTRGLAAKRRAERSGRWAEWAAVALLLVKGYRLAARRFRTPVGELDLVMRKARLLVFVEVKFRADPEGQPFVLGPRQQERLKRAAGLYIAAHPSFAGWTQRFDLVIITRRSLPKHMKNAW